MALLEAGCSLGQGWQQLAGTAPPGLNPFPKKQLYVLPCATMAGRDSESAEILLAVGSAPAVYSTNGRFAALFGVTSNRDLITLGVKVMKKHEYIGLLLIVMVGFPGVAWAYVDPGAGSMILQILLGGTAGLLCLLKLMKVRLLERLGFRKKGDQGNKD